MNLLVKANVVARVHVGMHDVGKDGVAAVFGRLLARHGVVAAIVHNLWHIDVDGPAHGEVEDVAGDEPGCNEDDKSDVTQGLVASVLEELGRL